MARSSGVSSGSFMEREERRMGGVHERHERHERKTGGLVGKGLANELNKWKRMTESRRLRFAQFVGNAVAESPCRNSRLSGDSARPVASPPLVRVPPPRWINQISPLR